MHSRLREREAALALDPGSLSLPRKQASHKMNPDPSKELVGGTREPGNLNTQCWESPLGRGTLLG